MAQTVHFAGNHKPVGISTRGAGSSGFSTVLGFSQLQNGRDYVFVARGVLGDLQGTSSDPAEALTGAEVMFTLGTGANRTVSNKAARVANGLASKLNGPTRGQPFQLIWRVFSYDTANPVELAARINTLQQNPTQVGGAFYVQAQVLAFDLTTIHGDGWTTQWSNFDNGPGVPMPRTDEAKFSMHAEFVAWNPTAPELLVFSEARIQPGSDRLPWLMELRAGPNGSPTGIDEWGSIGSKAGIAPGYAAAPNLEEMGTFSRFTPAADTDVLELWGRCGWPAASYPGEDQARYHGGSLFQVPLAALDFAQEENSAPGFSLFFADAPPSPTVLGIQPDIGPVSDPDDPTTRVSAPYVVLCRSLMVGRPTQPVSATPIVRHNAAAGVGARVKRETAMGSTKFPATDPNGTAEAFLTPCDLFEFVIPREVNILSMEGYHTQGSLQGQVTQAGNAQILGLLTVNEEPDSNVVAVPGPEVVINVDREALGLGSLSTLPIAPSRVQPVQMTGDELVEHIAERGDRRSWPRFLKVDRVVQLVWPGINEADRQTLEDFLESTSQHVFKHTLHREETERAFVVLDGAWSVDEVGWDATTESRLYRVALQAAELTWLGV